MASPIGSIVCTAVFGFVAAAVITLSRGWPALPISHDESSLVLAADTFAHGRLTNPTPPFWEHFETFHVLMRPSYASKYPPAQGLVLALGQVLTGHPIVGVWLSTALLGATLTWMLRGWFRSGWALWGSALVMLVLAGNAASNGYWLSTFWGGTVAATGAALVYGSVRRLPRSPSALNAVLFALGLGILALSRPFEGALVAIPALVVTARWLVHETRKNPALRLRPVLTPFALVLGAIAAFGLIHNVRVTGHVLRFPYVEYEAQYSNVPLFVFPRTDTDRNIEYRNDAMRKFYAQQSAERNLQSVRALLGFELERVTAIKRFLAPGLTLILVFVAATSGMWRTLALPLTGTSLVLLGAVFVTWFFPHYIAPVIAPWAILLTIGARQLGPLQPQRRRAGGLLVWFIFAVTAFSALLAPFKLLAERPARRARWFVQRDSIARALTADGRRHLILVSYGANHNVHDEWVYNRANLSESPIIWARSLTPAQNARLVEHFRDRSAWRIQVDSAGAPLRFSPASVGGLSND